MVQTVQTNELDLIVSSCWLTLQVPVLLLLLRITVRFIHLKASLLLTADHLLLTFVGLARYGGKMHTRQVESNILPSLLLKFTQQKQVRIEILLHGTTTMTSANTFTLALFLLAISAITTSAFSRSSAIQSRRYFSTRLSGLSDENSWPGLPDDAEVDVIVAADIPPPLEKVMDGIGESRQCLFVLHSCY